MKIIDETETHTLFEDNYNNHIITFLLEKATNEIRVNKEDFCKCIDNNKPYYTYNIEKNFIIDMFFYRIQLTIILDLNGILYN